MDLEENKFERLVVRFLDKTITDDELKELRVLLGNSGEQRRQFRVIRSVWLQAGLLQAKEKFNAEEALRRLKGELERRRRWILFRRVFRYAAVLVVVSVGGYLLYQNGLQQRENSVVLTEVHSPGFGKVFLEFAVGKQMDVTEKRDTSFMQVMKQQVAVTGDPVDKNVEERAWKRLFTTKGAVYPMMLADGTKVWLNEESELKFPEVFEGEKREVYVKGEAYFDVEKDAKSSFIVHSSAGTITVLGTQFNVSDYAGESTCVTLVEGSVELRDLENREKKILPGQQGLFGKDRVEVKEVDVEEVIAWKEGVFVYKEKRLDDILKSLARWYDLEIFYQNTPLGEEVYTAKFERFDSVDIIFRRLEDVGYIKFERKGDTIIVRENKKEYYKNY